MVIVTVVLTVTTGVEVGAVVTCEVYEVGVVVTVVLATVAMLVIPSTVNSCSPVKTTRTLIMFRIALT